ncbi:MULTISPECIES: HlyD family efflux transporter periplasmic adaptor subunit [unclassified Ensifer]|uniref:HlyD family efflux transporter periplasmic adaptor subunit n=1 Tax=unclassified Ensifer TaxID=2633371 RepID=UPI0030105237
MTSPLFRTEATVTLTNTLSTSLQHPSLKHPAGVTALLGAIVVATIAFSFVHISLGVTASGVLRTADGSGRIVAERSGILTFVTSERQEQLLAAGTTVARIRSLDLPTKRNSPNPAFSMDELNRRQQRLAMRLEEIGTAERQQEQELAATQASVKLLMRQVEELNVIYERELKRVNADLMSRRQARDRGLVKGTEVAEYENILTDRTIQFRDNHIRYSELQRQAAELRMRQYQNQEAFNQEKSKILDALSDLKMSIETEARIAPFEIRMPETGILVPRGFREGQSVAAGDILFEVVGRSEEILFEADVDASQIGELKQDLPVKIAITAYPYFEYGFLNGQVKFFTRTPNRSISFNEDIGDTPKFRVVISADRDSLHDFKKGKTLIPGMGATIHIRKERVPFWRLALSPLLRLGERI